ncbi:hypothetical protein CR970_02410 [Candidatus Saccharibacteria bacterium]|nr:MAG: hypothetical protein CR970_02410 [Candidatus Saccharibacteria bacterium]
MAMDEVGLGKCLQKARREAGLTQQELCHRADISYSTLAKIERGAIKSPSFFTVQSIAAGLGVSLNELVGVPQPAVPAKHTAKSGVRFVYFDINGCLVRFFHRAFTMLAEDTSTSSDIVESTFWHYNDAVCRGDISLDDFNMLLAERLGVSSVDWTRYYLEAAEPMPGMTDIVAWAAEHYQIGLMSNIMPGLIDAMRDAGTIPDVAYNQIIDSSVVHAIKPDDEMYDVAARRSGMQSQEILLVDDSRQNLMAAEHIGWHVLWFDDYRPDETIQRIRDALQLG